MSETSERYYLEPDTIDGPAGLATCSIRDRESTDFATLYTRHFAEKVLAALNAPPACGVLLSEEEATVLDFISADLTGEDYRVVNNFLSRARSAEQGDVVAVRREVLERFLAAARNDQWTMRRESEFADPERSLQLDTRVAELNDAIAEAEAALAKGGE